MGKLSGKPPLYLKCSMHFVGFLFAQNEINLQNFARDWQNFAKSGHTDRQTTNCTVMVSK